MISFKKKDKGGDKEIGLSVEKLSLSNTVSIEALVELLARKGVIDKKELLEEVKKIGKNAKVYSEDDMDKMKR